MAIIGSVRPTAGYIRLKQDRLFRDTFAASLKLLRKFARRER
jgi:hypothetical protein